jgi:pimeloyl-ACP methyl ester carboxylesterase
MNSDDGFPYAVHAFEVEGSTMRYVDEGNGPAVLLVHGTPTWSYLYRRFIRALAPTHRVVAPDHLGFGRSDKPSEADYLPAAQARRLEALIEHLGLRDFVLAVHDFGGPIGLSYALDHPEHIRGIVLFNTWMWSLAGSPNERIARIMSGRIGRFLYERLNFSPRVLLKAGFADRAKLSRDVHEQYLAPFPSKLERHALWVYARELLGSSDWYAGLWSRRARLAPLPAILLWGMRDPAFGPAYLERWREALPHARVAEFPDAGHFVQEEAPDGAIDELRRFLEALDGSGRSAAQP